MIEDPEPARQQLASDDVAAEVVDRHVQLMLMRCGKVLFAIDAISVYATVSDPQLQASPLARGACRGVMRYGASDVPMLDLMDCCGMGEQRADQSLQGFLLRHDDGLVGLLVEQVVDVLSIDPAEVVALPAHVLPRGTLFAGTLALAEPAVPAHAAGQYLVLDGQALAGEEALSNLARASQPEGSCSRGASQAAADPGRVMVIYEAVGEVATPLMQVTEILPYPAEHVLFEHLGPLLGVMTHRGRSVPIYCLRRVLGAEALLDAVPAAVLLVEDDGETAAFVVQRLLDIVTGAWEPSLPGHGTPGASARPLVQVNQGQRQRMLPMVDLVQRMRELRPHRQAA
jgi:purine-binding chemotaxis protein CheW